MHPLVTTIGFVLLILLLPVISYRIICPIARVWRRRWPESFEKENPAPWCRGCHYTLTALRTSNCPECGRDLTAPGSVTTLTPKEQWATRILPYLLIPCSFLIGLRISVACTPVPVVVQQMIRLSYAPDGAEDVLLFTERARQWVCDWRPVQPTDPMAQITLILQNQSSDPTADLAVVHHRPHPNDELAGITCTLTDFTPAQVRAWLTDQASRTPADQIPAMTDVLHATTHALFSGPFTQESLEKQVADVYLSVRLSPGRPWADTSLPILWLLRLPIALLALPLGVWYLRLIDRHLRHDARHRVDPAFPLDWERMALTSSASASPAGLLPGPPP